MRRQHVVSGAVLDAEEFILGRNLGHGQDLQTVLFPARGIDEQVAEVDGIHVQRRKVKNSTGKRTIYAWTPALRDEIFYAMELRPKKVDWLFCTRKGTSYYNEERDDYSGWDSVWQRFMERVMKERKVKQSLPIMTCGPSALAMPILWSRLASSWRMPTAELQSESIGVDLE